MTFRRWLEALTGRLGAIGMLAVAAPACGTERRSDPSAAPERRVARPSADLPPSAAQQPPGPSGDDSEDPPEPSVGGGAFNPTPLGKVRFVVIGDYGWSGPAEQQVAELVDSFEPDYVVTTGDNNYPMGAASTIDRNIGQYFSELIHPYHGTYASSATENRFFPALGNHDWYTDNASAYLAYFTLPGNERYYDVVRGDVHFFAIDSDEHEPDGNDASSEQASWLKRALAASKSAFNVVAMHHPPYSSGPHGSTPATQWPYAEWGADLVLAGHDHGYERLNIDGITYVVSGLGGTSIYSFGLPVAGSLVRYNDQYGATVFDADALELRLSFFNIDGQLVDSVSIASH